MIPRIYSYIRKHPATTGTIVSHRFQLSLVKTMRILAGLVKMGWVSEKHVTRSWLLTVTSTNMEGFRYLFSEVEIE